MILPPGLAASPSNSRGRLHPEKNSGPRGPRDIFQRDRDRLIHSIAFRRLRHKTQVFIAPDGDHFRVRLTHSLEVAQIGRTIARALGLSEDLTEALCLSHDLGHPPFGHAGEDALSAAMAEAGGFDHNAHAIRIVTRLETPYPDFDGLNLSWEALEGLAKHNGPVLAPTWAMAEANVEFDLQLTSWPGLEAQVAAISDDIAYDNHDIDDGLRAGLLDIDELIELPIVRRLWDAIDKRHPGLSTDKRQRALVRDMIGYMVGDVLAETERRVRQSGVETSDDVRTAGRSLAGFSEALEGEERELKQFLYARLYNLAELQPIRKEAERVVANLAGAYRSDPTLLPEHWRRGNEKVDQLRTIGDFIAGMTDRFAIARHEELIGPVTLPSNRF
jgi:dGTPase